MCVYLTRVPKYMMQKLIKLKSEIDNFTIIVENFNASFSVNDRTKKKNINKNVMT